MKKKEIIFRMSTELYQAIKEDAQAHFLTVTGYIRDTLYKRVEYIIIKNRPVEYDELGIL